MLKPATISFVFTLMVTSATLHAEVTIPFTVPDDGRVSLALYDGEGRMVRTLLAGKPLAKGQHTTIWDGLDRYGTPLPAGDYRWNLIATEGLRSEFITQVGQNVEPAWERATGNHQPPNAAAIDATGLYRQGSVNEGAHWGVKTDLNGRTIWVNDRNQADPWMGGGEALTLVDGRLFELMRDGTVYGSDAATGRVFTGSDTQPKPWNLRWESFVAPAGTRDEERRKHYMEERPQDLCGDPVNGLLVAAYPQHDALAWFSARDGNLVDTVKGISKPLGIAVAPDGSVRVISQGALLALSRQDKNPRVVIAADRLESPWRVAVSAKTGDIFVAENSDLARGKAEAPVPDVADGKTPDLAAGVKLTPGSIGRHHQVLRFTADGHFVQAFGRAEGRGDGVYVPTDFRGLTDIEADAEGGFIVTEGNHTPPRRTARFNGKGELRREWYGAQHYGIIACPEPGDPKFVWTRANADIPALLRWEVDYQAKTCRLVEVYQDSLASNRLFRNNSSHGSAVPTVFQSQGRVYIYNGAMGSLTLHVYDPITKRVRPSNASSGAGGHAIIWNDLNDDGQVSDEEIMQLNRNVVGGYIDPDDLSIRTTPFGTAYQAGHQLRPARITVGGTPVYDWSLANKVEPWKENGRTYHPLDFRHAADGSWFGTISESLANPFEGTENHGAWYYNSCSGIDRLVKWSGNGKPLWSVGKHSSDDDHELGTTAMPRGLVGYTHGCVIWADASDEEIARPTVWTEDGLFVDELLRVPIDNLPKLKHGEDNTNEYPTGHLYTDPQTGETFFYALNSGGGAPIYRITGWDRWHRSSGMVKLAAPAVQVAKRDGTGLKGEYFNSPDCTGEPVLSRTDKLVFFYWFRGKEGLPKGLDQRSFSCRWTGQVEAPTSERYRFVFESYAPWRGEGWGTPGRPRWLKLWIAGNLVLDTAAHLYEETTFGLPQHQGIYAEVPLHAGERYDLRLECGFATNAVARLCWESPGLDRQAIPSDLLHPESGPKKMLELAPHPRPDLLAHFDFEETQSVLCRSRAGGDVFGRLTGRARRVPGKIGQAIELEANGDFQPALFPVDEELRLPDSNYTIAFWFKTTAENLRLCEARRYSSYNNRWSDHVVSVQNGRVRFQLQGDAALESSARFNDGQWHCLVTTVEPGGQRLYVDSQLQGTGKLAKRLKASNRLGLDLGPGGGLGHVAIDEAKVFGRDLTENEIAQLR